MATLIQERNTRRGGSIQKSPASWENNTVKRLLILYPGQEIDASMLDLFFEKAETPHQSLLPQEVHMQSQPWLLAPPRWGSPYPWSRRAPTY